MHASVRYKSFTLRCMFTHRFHSGFTLIELSIVLLLIGLMAGVGITFLSESGQQACTERTKDQLKRIQEHVQAYVAANGRLPRPALMLLGSSNSEFGQEVDTLPNPDLIDASDVLIGTLPHATLGLPLELAADCWGNKFTYAVTKSLTSSDSGSGYIPSAGGISINAGTRASPDNLLTNGAYVVISHGADKKGATPLSAADIMPRWCNLADGTEIDRENCDASNPIFFDGFYQPGNVAENFFDDLMAYEQKVASTPVMLCVARRVTSNVLTTMPTDVLTVNLGE